MSSGGVSAGTVVGGTSTGASGSGAGLASGGSGSGSGTNGSSGSITPDAGLDGGLAVAPSCAPGGPGMTNCGANGESCCTSLDVAGGTYYRTYDLYDAGVASRGVPGIAVAADGGPTGEADPASVSSFRLDKYLVTVGRFRQFANAWNGGNGYTPQAGSGKHSHLNGGNGLNATGGGFEPGWVTADNVNIAPTNLILACDPMPPPNDETWTNTPGNQENLPINCVNWYEAYAFCIWDGGFLPSEAEWEYAAAGGSQQREYPWGSTDPGTANQYAIYLTYYNTGNSTNIAPVGYATQGVGLWGQLDMAGEVSEWNLDGYAAYTACTDCTDVSAEPKVFRGGGVDLNPSYLLAPYRDFGPPTLRAGSYGIGFRCSRSP